MTEYYITNYPSTHKPSPTDKYLTSSQTVEYRTLIPGIRAFYTSITNRLVYYGFGFSYVKENVKSAPSPLTFKRTYSLVAYKQQNVLPSGVLTVDVVETTLGAREANWGTPNPILARINTDNNQLLVEFLSRLPRVKITKRKPLAFAIVDALTS